MTLQEALSANLGNPKAQLYLKLGNNAKKWRRSARRNSTPTRELAASIISDKPVGILLHASIERAIVDSPSAIDMSRVG